MKQYLSFFLFSFLILTSCGKEDVKMMEEEEEEEEEMEIDSCLTFQPSSADFEISNSSLINVFCEFLEDTEIGEIVFSKDTFDYPAALVFTSLDVSNDEYEWTIQPSNGSPQTYNINSTNLVLGDKEGGTITYTISLNTQKIDSLECDGSLLSIDSKTRTIHVMNPYSSTLHTDAEGTWQGESSENPGDPFTISFIPDEETELSFDVEGLVSGANQRVSAVAGARFLSISQSFASGVTTCGIGRINDLGQLVIDYYKFGQGFVIPQKYRFVGTKI